MSSSKRRIELSVQFPPISEEINYIDGTKEANLLELAYHLPDPLPPKHPPLIPNHDTDATAFAAAATTTATATAHSTATTLILTIFFFLALLPRCRRRSRRRATTAHRPATRHGRLLDGAGAARPIDVDYESRGGGGATAGDGGHAAAEEIRGVGGIPVAVG